MKIKILFLWGDSTIPIAISQLFESSEYDICWISGILSDAWLKDGLTFCPDLIVCPEQILKFLLSIQANLPKHIPLVIISNQEVNLSPIQMPDRPVAYLQLPFNFTILNAVIKLLL